MCNTIQQNRKVGFLRLFFPLNKQESTLFLCFLFFYLCISLYFAFFSSLIDHPTKETDLYFSLDNPLIFKYGRSHITAHPLTIIFYYPFVILGNFFAFLIGAKAKTLLFALLSSAMISLSCLYINRYIREIIELRKEEALLLTIFFALFSTNLILCFTPETFTLSAFFLSFCAYYYASQIKNNKKTPILSSTFLSCICLGGVTVTNFVKGVIPLFFLKESWKTISKKIVLAGLGFLGILVAMQIALYVIDGRDFYYSLVLHRGIFTSIQYDSIFDYLEQVYSSFWGAPIFFSEIVHNKYYSYNTQQTIEMINTTQYTSWWQYLYITLLTIALIWSFLRNYKNRFMLILISLLSVDLGIHVILKFGIDTPFIYGGHWIYTIPLIFAWLFKDIQHTYLKKLTIPLLLIVISVLAINNITRLIDFATLAKEMYPS